MKITSWFRARTPSEQVSLVALSVVGFLYCAIVLIINPIAAARDAAVLGNTRVIESQQRVEMMAAELERLRAGGGTGTAQAPNLMALVNRVSQQLALAITRLQPSANGDLQVRFESVAFEDVLAFVYQLESVEGAIVREVTVSQAQQGRVSATIRFGQGG
ncbi:MAG: type II secretion system protein GspM [Proteobacteria bacterium]|nr:type II secretion system protein GspM [Pseudomonadota bacterium]